MLTVFDMFSGGGGFRQGTERVGMKTIAHCEINKWAEKFYTQAFDTKDEIYFNDATTIISSELPEFDVLLAGFPCQSFSIAGKRQGFDDTRGTIFFEVARILKDKRPKYFILENVKGLLNHDSGRTFQTILKILANLGIYNIEWAVLNSKYFGVPQNRERIFIVGYPRRYGYGKIFPLEIATRKDNITTQKIIYWKNSKEKWVQEERATIGAIKTQSDLCRQPLIVQLARGNNKGGLKQDCPTITKNQWEYNNLLVEPEVVCGVGKPIFGKQYRQGDRVYSINAPSPVLQSQAGNASRRSVLIDDFNHRICKENIANTVRENFGNSAPRNGNKLLIENRIRRLTPLECFRLQGFPDEVFYKGSKGISDAQLYKIAGNSVTVNVVEAIAKRIVELERRK